LISHEQVEGALRYLAETDRLFAEAKTVMRHAEILVERAKARAFLEAEGSVAERTAHSKIHPDVSAAEDTYIAERLKYEKLQAGRDRACVVIDVWRSVESSRRAGVSI
jgi:hypothetical protein